jgi:hypothetical protein
VARGGGAKISPEILAYLLTLKFLGKVKVISIQVGGDNIGIT